MSLVKSLKKCARRVLPKKVRKALKKQIYRNKGNISSKEGKNRKISNLQNRMAELVALEANWDLKTAKEEMRKTKDAYGYTFKQYYENDLYSVPFEEQKEYFEKIAAEKKAQKAKEREEYREHYLNKVVEKTGWEKKYAKSVIRKTIERTECTYEEFFLYKFYELSEAEQDDVFLSKDSKKITKIYNVNRKFNNILYDKELSNIYFNEYLGRAWCVNNKNKISEDEFVNKFSGIKKVFYKPLKGHHGDGARPFELTSENIRDVYKELMELPIGVVEEYIVQHHDLNELAPSAVNTLRVVTISSNDKPVLEENGNNIEIVYASLKMGGKNSVVDNLVGGGMVAGVDLETGKLVTNAGDDQGNEYAEHPATGVTIKGFQIPFFNEAIQLVKDVYADKKMEGYLGWDIAITENGPVIIEINTAPGVILFQLPHMLDKQGKKPYMKKYYYTPEDYEQERKKNNSQRRKNCVQKTVEATGWTEEQAIKHIDLARKLDGVTYKKYIVLKLYQVEPENLAEEYKKRIDRRKRNEKKKQRCIDRTVNATGWDAETAQKHIMFAKKETGVKYDDYISLKLYQVDAEKLKEEYEKRVKLAEEEKKARRERIFKQKVDKTVSELMRIKGWDEDFAREKFYEAHNRIGCTPKEYIMYRFYDLTPEQQETFYLAKYQKGFQEKYGVDKEFVKILYNKEKTNLYLSEYVRRPWCVNTKVSLEEFKEIFKNSKRIMYKPIDGHRGYGVEAFYINEDAIDSVYKHLSNCPEGVVEEFIVQHPTMSQLSPSSVNSLRFVTFSSNKNPVTKDGKKMDIAYSIVRIGRGDSIVDNLHSGGMVANVDLEKGELATHGADRNGDLFVAHPETGTIIKGFKIPYFEEAKQMVLEAIDKYKIEGYLGWDIAISEKGPMLLELNDRPGSDGLQTAYAQEGIGMKHVMEKYM